MLRPWPPARAWALVMATLAAPIAPLAPEEQAPVPLTSAAIDASIYRDGEVRQFSATLAARRVVRDEIARLKQRIGSLRTPVIGPDGTPAAELTISTGEDGRGLRLFATAASDLHGLTSLQTPKRAAVSLHVDAAGFSGSVAVSTRPFDYAPNVPPQAAKPAARQTTTVAKSDAKPEAKPAPVPSAQAQASTTVF